MIRIPSLEERLVFEILVDLIVPCALEVAFWRLSSRCLLGVSAGVRVPAPEICP